MKKMEIFFGAISVAAIVWFALVLFVPAPAHSQQQADPATLQRFLVEMQRARDERANDAVAARAEVARLTEEAAKLKAEIERLKAQPDGRSDGR